MSKVVTTIALNFIVQCSKYVVGSIRGNKWISDIILLNLVPRVLITIPAPCISILSIGSAIYSLMSIIIASITHAKENILVLGHRRPPSWCMSFEIIVVSC